MLQIYWAWNRYTSALEIVCRNISGEQPRKKGSAHERGQHAFSMQNCHHILDLGGQNLIRGMLKSGNAHQDMVEVTKASNERWTLDEASRLVEAGFEYVCDIEKTKLFRKRK